MYTFPFRYTALVCDTVIFGEPAGDHVASVPAGGAAQEGNAKVAANAAASVMVRNLRVIGSGLPASMASERSVDDVTLAS
jgi:hypothetical protein